MKSTSASSANDIETVFFRDTEQPANVVNPLKLPAFLRQGSFEALINGLPGGKTGPSVKCSLEKILGLSQVFLSQLHPFPHRIAHIEQPPFFLNTREERASFSKLFGDCVRSSHQAINGKSSIELSRRLTHSLVMPSRSVTTNKSKSFPTPLRAVEPNRMIATGATSFVGLAATSFACSMAAISHLHRLVPNTGSPLPVKSSITI